MKIPKVSICMPTYNNEKYVSEAIKSCINQSYENLEICVSDDKSTDNTFEIVKELARLYPKKIKYSQMDVNMGDKSIAYNVNKALSMCDGKYVAILEGDDLMMPLRIEKQVKLLEENQSIFAAHHDLIFYDDKKQSEIKSTWKLRDHNVTAKELIIFGNFIFTPTLMFRNIGIVNELSIKRKLDWFLMVNLCQKGQFYYQNEKLTKYRLHENNITKLGFEDDIPIVLSLIEKSYPKLIRFVNIRRTMNYMKNLKNGDLNYIVPILSMGFFNILFSIISKIKLSRKVMRM